MAKFSSPQKQAASVMKEIQGVFLKSCGTIRNYQQALTRVAEFALREKIINGLRGINKKDAIRYLQIRKGEIGQKSIDMERQAMQFMMQHITKELDKNEKLPVIQSEVKQKITSRSYTYEQVQIIARSQTHKHALATRIAYIAGLRAHELLTLQHASERPADERPRLDTKFLGREGVNFTIIGKGGLIRDVMIPENLADKLEQHQLEEPVTITDRNIYYSQHYNIGGGKNWSNSFSSASKRCLGWSNGAHGLRHSYAQERMDELQKLGLTFEQSLETVSQEMGHFRPDITLVYLR